jgi:hypothetical protein
MCNSPAQRAADFTIGATRWLIVRHSARGGFHDRAKSGRLIARHSARTAPVARISEASDAPHDRARERPGVDDPQRHGSALVSPPSLRSTPAHVVEPMSRHADSLMMTLAAGQQGLVTRAQLLAAGLSRHTIGRRSKSGFLRSLHAGVYLIGPVLPPRVREHAAVLACGAARGVHARRLRRWVARLEAPERDGVRIYVAAEPVDLRRVHTDPLGDERSYGWPFYRTSQCSGTCPNHWTPESFIFGYGLQPIYHCSSSRSSVNSRTYGS